jgi:hypothetical protein
VSDSTPAPINPLKDPDNPRSVINITPHSISHNLQYIPDSTFEMSERDLRKIVEPTLECERIRVAFWREYDKACEAKKNMNLSNVYSGICTQSWFLRHYTKDPFRLAYILIPPIDYEVSMIEALNTSIEQMREILAISNIDEKGKPNTKLMDTKVKIYESLLDRVKGAVPNRIESRNLNLNVEKKADETAPKLKSMKEIDERLKLLEAQANGEIIDVQAQDPRSSES